MKSYKKVNNDVYLISHLNGDYEKKLGGGCDRSFFNLPLLKFSKAKFKSYRKQKNDLYLLNLGNNFRAYLRSSDFKCEYFKKIEDNCYIASGKGLETLVVDFRDFDNARVVEIPDIKKFKRLNENYYILYGYSGDKFFLNLKTYRVFDGYHFDTYHKIKNNLFLLKTDSGLEKIIKMESNEILRTDWFKKHTDLNNGWYLLDSRYKEYNLLNLDLMKESQNFEEYLDLKNGFYLLGGGETKKSFLRLRDGGSSEGFYFTEYKDSKCISEFGSTATFNFETMEMSPWKF